MDEFIGPGTPLSITGLNTAVTQLGCPPEALWAVITTETSGCGFQPDRRPKILFERHISHRLTGGKFDATAPDISAPTPGGYSQPSGSTQYDRLGTAIALDRQAALQSASWGMGQIMGENFADAGYGTVGEMVADFVASEDAQIAGMAAFISASGMKAAIAAQNWAGFASRYNGADYAKNNYDGHLSTYCSHYVAHGCPDLNIRAAQILLTYRGYDVGGIDNLLGPKTRAALAAFRKSAGLPGADGPPDPATLGALAF